MFALPIFPEERWERRLWRSKRPERVAAVYIFKATSLAVENIGHRNIARQIILKRVRRLPDSLIVFALPIFPGSRPPSIVGTNELNFCVRDGNRWTLIVINTNYSSLRIW